MSQGGTATQHQTLLDLLSAGQHIRLAFQPSLVDPIVLTNTPFHWAALTGDLALAVFLYRHAPASVVATNITLQLPVAVFTSQGLSNSTPWSKTLGVNPRETALLAGHAKMAEVLEAMEQGMPLAWAPEQHHKLPQRTRSAVGHTVRALAGSAWFHQLPGPARQEVVRQAADDVLRSTVWGPLGSEEWGAAAQPSKWLPPANLAADLRGLLGPAAAATALPCTTTSIGSGSGSSSSSNSRSGSPASSSTHDEADGEGSTAGHPHAMPHFHFRVAQTAGSGGSSRWRPGGRGSSWLGLLARGTLSLAVWALASRCKRDHKLLVVAYLAGAASGITLPGTSLLVAQLLASLSGP